MLDRSRLRPTTRIAALYLHPGCDLACRFCAAERDFDALSQQQAEDVVDALAGAGFESVVLGGGEPLLWRGDLGRLARHAKDRGLLVQLCTNAVRLPADLAVLDAIDRFLLPFESVEPEVHDALRAGHAGAGGHHALVHARTAQLVAAGRELTFATVVTARNVDGLNALGAELAALAASGARVHAWHLYRFLPVGRGGRPHAPELSLDPARYLAAATRAQRAGLPFRVYRRDDMLRSTTVEHVWLEGGALRLGSEEHAQRGAG